MLMLILNILFSQSAAFGLSFGMSFQQVKDSGIVLSQIYCEKHVCKYSAVPIKQISWGKSYFLYFGDDSLGKIEVYSDRIYPDYSGTIGINTFLKTDSILSTKYISEPTTQKFTTKYNNDNFYKNLNKYGASDWKRYYTGDGKYISLELLPKKKYVFWSGVIKMAIEKTPGWSKYENNSIEIDSIKVNDFGAL